MNMSGAVTKAGHPIDLGAHSLQRLRDAMAGALIMPDDPGYDSARRVWNGMVDKRPGIVAQCANDADVAACVDFAREHGLLTSIRAGGHNVSGAAVAEGGFVIDVSHMRGVRVDPDGRTARVEGGARLGDVDRETQPFGLAAPMGVVSATGVAGLTVHGGAGWLLRKHGLSIDNLVSAEIVTADGRKCTVSETENSDLFWAIRGGGGNFGVVTSFEFTLHPVGPQVWMTFPMYPLDRADDTMAALRDYMSAAPEDLMVLGVFWSAPDIPEVPAKWRGAPVIILLGCYTGPPQEAERVIAPLRAFGTPVADLTAPMDWVQAQKSLDEDYPDGAFYYWKSIYLDRLDGEVAQALAKHTASRPSPASSLDVWMLGGAAARVKPEDTAFYNRAAPFMLGIEANWRNPEDHEANIAWARNVFDDMRRFSKGGVYLNFPGYLEDREALLKAGYGPNLERLRDIKAAHDPGGLFTGLLSITPDSA